MKLSDIIDCTEYEYKFKETNIEFCTSDYKRSNEKALLFMLPGVNFDTRELINEFISSKAAIIVTEYPELFPNNDNRILGVKNARKAYAYAMSNFEKIDYKQSIFIGITGTNGKTSTATLISRIFAHAGKKCGFIGTGKIEYPGKRLSATEYSMTCPDPHLLYPAIKEMQNAGCEIIVMEVSSHALELSKVAPIIFDIGIFTGLSHDHLEFHGSMENYFEAKRKLMEQSKKVIINYDDPWGKRLYNDFESKATGIGVVWRADRTAMGIRDNGLCGIGYTFKGKSFLTRIDLPIPGIYNVYNSMLAFECAYQMNIPPMIIKEALRCAEPIEGRCECIFDDITVIIDYAHTPQALENILKIAKSSKKARQKLRLVFGCGGDRDPSKRAIMASVAEKYADFITVTNDNPRTEDEDKIFAEIISGFKLRKHRLIKDRKEAIERTVIEANKRDTVIIAGKGHEKYIIDKNGYHDFDEKEIIASALKKRNSEVKV